VTDARDRLRRLLEEGVERRVHPGAQAVVAREGRPVAAIEVGRRGPRLEPTGPTVRYDLASLTKALGTAALWARAWERGRVDPADRLADRYPGADPRVEHDHLLRHVSGLPAHRRFDRALPAPIRPGSPAARAWITRSAAETPLDRVPGTARYSDLGFIALGGVLTSVMGASLADQLRGIGCPLGGPPRTGFEGPPPPAERATGPTRVAPSGRTPVGAVHDENAFAMGGLAGHAGLFGSAQDVAAWAERFLAAFHGARDAPWAPETLRALWQPRPGAAWVWGWDRPTPGGTTGGAWPPDAVGHLGFTGTSLWIHPASTLVAVLLTNRTAVGGRIDALRAIRQAFHREVWAAWGPATPRAG